jgi:two-component system, chemotaxis family, chemotaxis protein CheY
MKKILLIEDDAPLSWLLQQMLIPKYEVMIMSDGLEALSWLTDGNDCDLIISDIKLPTISGVELLEHIAENSLLGHLPVIIISANEDLMEKCLALGAFAFHLKPFQPQKLLSDVRQALQYQPAYVTPI